MVLLDTDHLSILDQDTMERQVAAYQRLRGHIERFRKIPLIDYHAAAAAEYERLRQQRVRIGTMDLKIAAIALSNDMTLITRNLRDFSKVPGLRAEDWSN